MADQDPDAAAIVVELQEARRAERDRAAKALLAALLLILIRQSELTARLEKQHSIIMAKEEEILAAITFRNRDVYKR